MGRVRKSPIRLGAEQALATDPFADAALSASAGTGKTHVLTARVLRLLLHGVRPESILTVCPHCAEETAENLPECEACGQRLR